MMEATLLVLSSLTHQTVGMGVKSDAVAEGLDAGHNPRHKLFASGNLSGFLLWQKIFHHPNFASVTSRHVGNMLSVRINAHDG